MSGGYRFTLARRASFIRAIRGRSVGLKDRPSNQCPSWWMTAPVPAGGKRGRASEGYRSGGALAEFAGAFWGRSVCWENAHWHPLVYKIRMPGVQCQGVT
jgi:hypothetical protein